MTLWSEDEVRVVYFDVSDFFEKESARMPTRKAAPKRKRAKRKAR